MVTAKLVVAPAQTTELAGCDVIVKAVPTVRTPGADVAGAPQVPVATRRY